jgi:hypothetical protein
MSVLWCEHVDGSLIFPKLPAYLRLYYERWVRNQRVQDAVHNSKNDLKLLENATLVKMFHPCHEDTAGKESPMMEEENGDFEHEGCIKQNNAGQHRGPSEPSWQIPWEKIGGAPVAMLLQPHFMMAIRPHLKLRPPTVGGGFNISSGWLSRSESL